jgi:hypothetical protein
MPPVSSVRRSAIVPWTSGPVVGSTARPLCDRMAM